MGDEDLNYEDMDSDAFDDLLYGSGKETNHSDTDEKPAVSTSKLNSTSNGFYDAPTSPTSPTPPTAAGNGASGSGGYDDMQSESEPETETEEDDLSSTHTIEQYPKYPTHYDVLLTYHRNCVDELMMDDDLVEYHEPIKLGTPEILDMLQGIASVLGHCMKPGYCLWDYFEFLERQIPVDRPNLASVIKFVDEVKKLDDPGSVRKRERTLLVRILNAHQLHDTIFHYFSKENWINQYFSPRAFMAQERYRFAFIGTLAQLDTLNFQLNSRRARLYQKMNNIIPPAVPKDIFDEVIAKLEFDEAEDLAADSKLECKRRGLISVAVKKPKEKIRNDCLITDITMFGWLSKRGEGSMGKLSAKKRYFRLRGHLLRYYVDEKAGAEHKGVIDVRRAKIHDETFAPFAFSIEGPHCPRKFELQPKDGAEKNDWVYHLRAAAQGVGPEPAEPGEAPQEDITATAEPYASPVRADSFFSKSFGRKSMNSNVSPLADNRSSLTATSTDNRSSLTDRNDTTRNRSSTKAAAASEDTAVALASPRSDMSLTSPRNTLNSPRNTLTSPRNEPPTSPLLPNESMAGAEFEAMFARAASKQAQQQEEETETKIQGYLLKRGAGLFPKFKRRWFRTDGALLIYHREKGGEELGMINLKGATVQAEGEKIFSIDGKYTQRRFEMQTTTEEEKNVWVKVLGKIAYSASSTGMSFAPNASMLYRQGGL